MLSKERIKEIENIEPPDYTTSFEYRLCYETVRSLLEEREQLVAIAEEATHLYVVGDIENDYELEVALKNWHT